MVELLCQFGQMVERTDICVVDGCDPLPKLELVRKRNEVSPMCVLRKVWT